MRQEPFSRIIHVRDVSATGRRIRVEADEAERRRLAEALGIEAIAALVANLEVRQLAGHVVKVGGTLNAAVVQADVVTLDPVSQNVVEAIDVTLMPAKRHASQLTADVPYAPPEADAPDVYNNGRIDLGVIVGEHLALGIDPYPRAAKSAFAGHLEDDSAADESPFAVLAGLKGSAK